MLMESLHAVMRRITGKDLQAWMDALDAGHDLDRVLVTDEGVDVLTDDIERVWRAVTEPAELAH